MITYKGMSKEITAYGGYQYEVGKTSTQGGEIECCSNGLHSCEAPFDVLRYFPLKDGNRYFVCDADGEMDVGIGDDSKLASSKLTINGEIGLPGLIKAQIEYTQKKAESGTKSGDESNLAGSNWSNLAGGNKSNLAGGYESNLAGGNGSNLAGGNWSNLAGGYGSNLAGGNWSNLAGGDGSLIVARNESRARGGLWSVLVLTEWTDDGRPTAVKAVIVDGKTVKADTWYMLKNGKLTEAEND